MLQNALFTWNTMFPEAMSIKPRILLQYKLDISIRHSLSSSTDKTEYDLVKSFCRIYPYFVPLPFPCCHALFVPFLTSQRKQSWSEYSTYGNKRSYPSFLLMSHLAVIAFATPQQTSSIQFVYLWHIQSLYVSTRNMMNDEWSMPYEKMDDFDEITLNSQQKLHIKLVLCLESSLLHPCYEMFSFRSLHVKQRYHQQQASINTFVHCICQNCFQVHQGQTAV